MAEKRNTPSRRAMLATIAAVPVAGLPAIAGAVADNDPAFAALAEIERAKAAEDLAWKACSDLCDPMQAARVEFPDVFFNGERVFNIPHLEALRERSMGMTDEELDDTIARLRKGNAALRAEAAHLEPEYQSARAVLEAREPYAQNADESDALEAAAERARDATSEAEVTLLETTPTTPAGAAKLLRFIAEFLDEDDVVNDLWVGDMIGDAIRSAVDVFEREARS